jgi:hypothetical protein
MQWVASDVAAEVDLLDYELFIEVQRPVVAVPRTDLLPEG